MTLTPIDEAHALQIQAGTLGRKAGHAFEDRITEHINGTSYPLQFDDLLSRHLNIGEPAYVVLNYISSVFGKSQINQAVAISTGALATSEEGKKWLEVNGVRVKRCKSDLIITLKFANKSEETIGVSTKQCNNKNPTNAQLYFTTARGFSALLKMHGMPISDAAVDALRQFCGDKGFRPSDLESDLEGRQLDPRRYFWEEINDTGRSEWEKVLGDRQDEITGLLIQKAYLDDPFAPDLVLHKTKRSETWDQTELAIYTVGELIHHSREYGGFSLKPYSVRKGSYKDPPGAAHHMAPRFGIVQMQRGGQAQHPEQLQFNLQAGYFYKINQKRSDVLRDGTS